MNMSREILGIYTQPRKEAKVVSLRLPVVYTFVESHGWGFTTEAFDKAFKRERRLMLFGLPVLPLPSKKEAFRYLSPQTSEIKQAADLLQPECASTQLKFAR